MCMSLCLASTRCVELHDGLILLVMTLREVVLFPRSIVPLFVGRGASIKAIESALQSYDKKIFLVTQKDAQLENPTAQDVFETGTVCNILQMLRLPDKTIKILFEGLYRASCKKEELELDPETISHVQVYQLPETEENNAESQALIRATQEAVEEYGRINQKITRESILAMSTIGTPGRLADAVIPHLKIDFLKKQNVLEELDGDKRLELVFSLLQGEIEIFSLEKKIIHQKKQASTKQQARSATLVFASSFPPGKTVIAQNQPSCGNFSSLQGSTSVSKSMTRAPKPWIVEI